MRNSVFLAGNRVRVTSYGPFRGLEGIIQRVDTISDDREDPFCFYLIALEGTAVQAPIWFECHEVECIGFPASAPHLSNRLTNVGSGY